jgi:hypothetical protein
MKMGGQVLAPATYPGGKRLQYPFTRRLSRPQNKYRLFGEEKKISALTADRQFLDRPTHR